MTSAKRSRAGRAVLLAFIAGLVFLSGRASVPEPVATKPTPAASAVRTPSGALRAALDYLSALRWDVLVDDRRRRGALARHALPAAVPELDAELAGPAELLRNAVTSRPVLARPVVLGYRIETFAGNRASIAVWGMALFGTPAYPPTTQWSTSTIDLVWSLDRWLVIAVRSRGGPSPQSPLSMLVRADRTFRQVRREP